MSNGQCLSICINMMETGLEIAIFISQRQQ